MIDVDTDEVKLSITAIIAIVILMSVALIKGFDGVLLAGALAIIAGIAGFIMPSPLRKREF